MPKQKKTSKKKSTPKKTIAKKPKAAKFVIYFDPAAQIRYVAAIERALGSLGGTSIVQRNDHFTARLKWGTERKDRNNLMGRLNATANRAVTSVENG